MQKITQSQWKFIRSIEKLPGKDLEAIYECGLCQKEYRRLVWAIEGGYSKCCINCSRQLNRQAKWLVIFRSKSRPPITVLNLAKWAKDNGYPLKRVENKASGHIKGVVCGIKSITKLPD